MSSKGSRMLCLSFLFLLVGHVFAHEDTGTVYVADNSAAGNSVLRFVRNADGTLVPGGSFATGGLGTGAGLGNQGGLVLGGHGKFLFVVNAGSDEISAFSVTGDGLRLTDRKASGGQRPVSLTESRGRLYVVNAGGAVGGSDNISGFYVTPHGQLVAIPGSTQPLSQAVTNPAQIGFDQEGEALLVTERATNRLAVFRLDYFGRARAGRFIDSNAPTPFGFALGRRDQVFVADAVGGAAGASAVSAYKFDDGRIRAIGGPVPTTQTAACWLALAGNGRRAFTSNTGSRSLSEFSIAFDGTPTLVNAAAASTAGGPIDLAFSSGDRYLYVLENNGTIDGFRLEGDGSLTLIATLTAPTGTNGLIAE